MHAFEPSKCRLPPSLPPTFPGHRSLGKSASSTLQVYWGLHCLFSHRARADLTKKQPVRSKGFIQVHIYIYRYTEVKLVKGGIDIDRCWRPRLIVRYESMYIYIHIHRSSHGEADRKVNREIIGLVVGGSGTSRKSGPPAKWLG